jgi:hypothetical protein
MTEPLLISVAKAAKMVGIGIVKAYELVNSGEWPTVQIGKRTRRVPVAFLRQRYADVFTTAQEASNA